MKQIMKVLGSIVILMLVIGLGISATAVVAGEVSVSINNIVDVSKDVDFTVAVNIDDVVDLSAAQYDVTFDPSVLRLDNITSGQIDSTAIGVVYNEISPGRFRVVQLVGLGFGAVSGSGYLSVLHFHVIGSMGQSGAINIASGKLSSIDGEISAAWTGGSVNVISAESGGGEPSPPTPPSPESASAPVGGEDGGQVSDSSLVGGPTGEKEIAALPPGPAALSPTPPASTSPSAPPIPPLPPAPSPAKTINWPALWGTIGGVVIVIGLFFFLRVRRRLY